MAAFIYRFSHSRRRSLAIRQNSHEQISLVKNVPPFTSTFPNYVEAQTLFSVNYEFSKRASEKKHSEPLTTLERRPNVSVGERKRVFLFGTWKNYKWAYKAINHEPSSTDLTSLENMHVTHMNNLWKGRKLNILLGVVGWWTRWRFQLNHFSSSTFHCWAQHPHRWKSNFRCGSYCQHFSYLHLWT